MLNSKNLSKSKNYNLLVSFLLINSFFLKIIFFITINISLILKSDQRKKISPSLLSNDGCSIFSIQYKFHYKKRINSNRIYYYLSLSRSNPGSSVTCSLSRSCSRSRVKIRPEPTRRDVSGRNEISSFLLFGIAPDAA